MIVNEQASRIAAPADTVWPLFATEDGQRKLMGGFIAAIEFDGQGIGSIRTLHTGGHLKRGCVKERLIQFDPHKRELAYEITDTGDIVPFANYHGWVKVIPAGEDACVVALRSTFLAVDMPEAQAKEISVANFHALFETLRTLVAR